MNTNFNMVKKPKKDEDLDFEDEEVEEIEEDSDSETKSNNNNESLRNRMFLLMGIILGGMILLLVILYVASLFSNKTYEYTDIENIMTKAAKEYFADNKNYLPTEDGNTVEVDVSNLVAGNYMKNLSEYTKEGVTCSGTVQVTYSSKEYLYTPYLNCGDQYLTTEFYSKVLSDESVVSSGYGLYSNNGSYVYRGENVNNYVKLDNSLWRIVKINSNNNVVLINAEGLEYTQPWDDRYNQNKLYAAGINTYSASRAKEFLDRIYTKPEKKSGEDILSNSDKAKLVSYTLCTGKKVGTSSDFTNNEECQEHLANQKMGLLTASDYVYASIDPNCSNITSKSCQNYNYLAIDDDWWLVTANSADNSSAYRVDRTGVIKSDSASNYAIIRPVIYLNSNVLYKSGNGTEKHPYKVR